MSRAVVATLAGVTAWIGLAATGPLLAERQEDEGDVVLLEAALEVSSFHAPEDRVVWSSPDLGKSDAIYQRLHLADIGGIDAARPFEVVVIDGAGTTVDTLSSEFLAARTEEWTGAAVGGPMFVKVLADVPPTGFHFTIDARGLALEPGAPLSIIGLDRREQMYEITDPAILKAARAVAKLSLVIDDDLASCTGFMISASRMLTNEHCIDSQLICNSAVAVFGYQRKNANTLLAGKSFHCTKLVQPPDHDLDYALIELAGEPGKEFGWLELAPRAVGLGEKLVLIQHPGGDPKDVSRHGCKVKTVEAPGVTAAATDFGHICDTKHGSSGSPVLDLQMRVIGLHHYSKAADGQPFDDQNRAVRTQKLQPALPAETPTPETPAPGGGR